MVGSGPPTQTLLSLLHLPRLPQGIKLDVQGERERERGREEEREGKGGREREEKKGSGRNIFPMSG